MSDFDNIVSDLEFDEERIAHHAEAAAVPCHVMVKISTEAVAVLYALAVDADESDLDEDDGPAVAWAEALMGLAGPIYVGLCEAAKTQGWDFGLGKFLGRDPSAATLATVDFGEAVPHWTIAHEMDEDDE